MLLAFTGTLLPQVQHGVRRDRAVLYYQAAFWMLAPSLYLVHGIIPLQLQSFAVPLFEGQDFAVPLKLDPKGVEAAESGCVWTQFSGIFISKSALFLAISALTLELFNCWRC